MNCYLEEDQVFELDGKDYIVLSNTKYDGKYYIFTNELSNENVPTAKYKLFLCGKKGVSSVTDEKLKEKLLEIFNADINDKINIISFNRGDNNA